MKFTAEIEIDDEYLDVLLDYHKGIELDSEYFENSNRQEIEREMLWEIGLLEGGFYSHYPLSPSMKGQIILDLFIKASKV